MNYQEYKQSLNQKLTDKVQKELSAFREEMQGKPPQEIYDAAYQIAIKNDIAECFSNTDPICCRKSMTNGLGGKIPKWRNYARP